jgi:hypothetical protein
VTETRLAAIVKRSPKEPVLTLTINSGVCAIGDERTVDGDQVERLVGW